MEFQWQVRQMGLLPLWEMLHVYIVKQIEVGNSNLLFSILLTKIHVALWQELNSLKSRFYLVFTN